jgi:hypothetical protein
MKSVKIKTGKTSFFSITIDYEEKSKFYSLQYFLTLRIQKNYLGIERLIWKPALITLR